MHRRRRYAPARVLLQLPEVGRKRSRSERVRVGRGGRRVTGRRPDHVRQRRVIYDPLGCPLHGRLLLLARVLVKAAVLLLMVERGRRRRRLWRWDLFDARVHADLGPGPLPFGPAVGRDEFMVPRVPHLHLGRSEVPVARRRAVDVTAVGHRGGRRWRPDVVVVVVGPSFGRGRGRFGRFGCFDVRDVRRADRLQRPYDGQQGHQQYLLHPAPTDTEGDQDDTRRSTFL